MKILVTGGLGFIGSNFIRFVFDKFKEKVEILNLDAGLVGSNKKNLIDIEKSKNYKLILGNINNKKLLEDIIPIVDGVINFAAESHVDRSIFDSKPFLESNIMGVYSILDVIKEKKPDCRFLQVSTDEVFGSLENELADESYPYRPSNPYSASKASAELIIESYRKTYGIHTIVTRCTNNYGPYQFPEKVIPKTIIRAKKNMKIPVYGSGKNIRDWIFVKDHCDAVMKVFENGNTGESYNISSSNEITNIELIEKILEYMGKSSDLIYYVEDRPGHDFRYGINSSKIRNEMNWKPTYSFEEGLQYTVEWYLNHEEWWKEIATKEMLEPTPWKKH